MTYAVELATDGPLLIAARALQGIGAAVAAPTGLALIATTYAVGHARNRAMAMSAAMQGVGSVLGLVLGGALTVVSWRLAFLINFPIGVIIIWIALTRLEETRHERLKLDITGALLATLACTAAVLVFTQGPPRGWVDPWVIGASVAVVVFFVAFLFVACGALRLARFNVISLREKHDDQHQKPGKYMLGLPIPVAATVIIASHDGALMAEADRVIRVIDGLVHE